MNLALLSDDLYSDFENIRPTTVSTLKQFGKVQLAAESTRSAAQSRNGFGRNEMLVSSRGKTAGGTAADVTPRPMTAIRAAGYSSRGNRSSHGNMSSPFGATSASKLGILEEKSDIPEEKVNQLEKKVNELIEESCFALKQSDLKLALERAKECAQKERILLRQREQSGMAEEPNMDLTFTVLLNLANQYAANEMYSEALNTYQIILKNRLFQNAGRLKVNMGNIYVKLGQYSKAVKLYRMALDQVPNTHKRLRIKIMQNIGILFVKMGKYSDALTSFEYIMGEFPDFKTGLNLILCYYTLGDKDRLKKSFQKLVEISVDVDDDDHNLPALQSSNYDVLREAIKGDHLQNIKHHRKQEAEWCILMAAKLISPVIESSLAAGFAWCIDILKTTTHVDLANELEINKAITYLKQKEFGLAIEVLQGFGKKKDTKMATTAATNLAFLYILQNDLTSANKYADAALNSDRYNSGALVNKGCCLYLQGDLQTAQECFKESLANDATCVEAMFNLGLTLKKAGHYEDAYDYFHKLHSMLPNQLNIIYQLANICERLQDFNQIIEWHQQLLGVVPTDPGVLYKMGELFDGQGDQQQAFQYYYDSYRYFPSKMEVISWLGAYFVDAGVYEKAISFFEKGSLMQPEEVKWHLMIASCYRRSGNYQKALQTYKNINKKFPGNVECLKILVRLSTDMGLNDVHEYSAALLAAERAQEAKENRSSSSLSRVSGRGSRNSSATSADFNPNNQKNQIKNSAGNASSEFSYADPLGVASERPRTSALRRNSILHDEEFSYEELGDDLLP